MQNNNNTDKIINQQDNQQDIKQDNQIDNYLEQLSEIERNVIIIAEQVLGNSFNINRSLGFIEWKNKK